jgi:acetyl esterase/lipase
MDLLFAQVSSKKPRDLTRDLLLSNTVRVHRKLRQAGVEAELHVYEGQSHAHYMRDVDAPETKEAFEVPSESASRCGSSSGMAAA